MAYFFQGGWLNSDIVLWFEEFARADFISISYLLVYHFYCLFYYSLKIFHVLILVVLLAGKVITIVMMQTTIVDVNGMEETAVAYLLTQITVQLVNV